MSTFTLHTADTAPEGSREALRGLERNIGFIPNLAAVIGGSPVAITSFVASQTALRSSTLTPLQREVVGITVSRFNSCEYSIAAHTKFAHAQGDPDDPAHDALRAFTLDLLEGHGHVTDAPLEHEQVLEVIAQIAYTTLANYVANVAEPSVDPAFA